MTSRSLLPRRPGSPIPPEAISSSRSTRGSGTQSSLRCSARARRGASAMRSSSSRQPSATPPMVFDFIKVLAPATVSFLIGILVTPLVSHYLYRFRCWKKRSVAVAADGRAAPISQKLHSDEQRQVPRMGGIIIWLATLATVFGFWLTATFAPSELSVKLNFFSRNQTWLTAFTLLVGAIVGFIDDYRSVSERGTRGAGGISILQRVAVVGTVGFIGAWWVFFKLDVASVIV